MTATPAAERRVEGADGIELAVYERGPADAPTVLLVHGYPDDHAVWDLVAARLEVDHHVVTYDVRGAGASGVSPATSGYRRDALAADIATVARATSPDRPVHLVGHDWGSIQAWPAVLDPELAPTFASFTSISGPGLDHVGAWVEARRRPGDHHWSQLARQSLRSAYIPALKSGVAARAWKRGLADRWPVVMARREGAAVDERWPGPNLLANATNGAGLYRANMGVAEAGSRRDLAPTSVPVQLVVATGDPYVSEALLEGIEAQAVTLVRHPVGGGHWLPRSRPDVLARLIAEHVAAVEAGKVEAEAGVDPDRDVVVVTGAGSGIGRSVCLAFAERGAHIVATDLRPDTAERTAQLCRLLGGTAEVHALDVTDPEALEALAKLVGETHGAPTVVVNNAGMGMAGRFLDMTDHDWAQLLDLNLWGVIRGSRAFGRLMVERGTPGHIVNIASAAAFTPNRAMSGYATSKAAVLMLTECLRGELAERGIGVSAICPGFVDTGIATATRYVGLSAEEQDARRTSADRLYKRRRVSPDAVADAVLRAVDRDLAVVPVAAEAHLGLLAQRFAPRLRRAIARIDLTPAPAPSRTEPRP